MCIPYLNDCSIVVIQTMHRVMVNQFRGGGQFIQVLVSANYSQPLWAHSCCVNVCMFIVCAVCMHVCYVFVFMCVSMHGLVCICTCIYVCMQKMKLFSLMFCAQYDCVDNIKL